MASPRLERMAESTRTEAEARLLTQPLWIVFIRSTRFPPYVSQEASAMLSEREALDHLRDTYINGHDVFVLHITEDGRRVDATEAIAGAWLQVLIDGGWDIEAIQGTRFIGRYFTNDEMERRFRSRY